VSTLHNKYCSKITFLDCIYSHTNEIDIDNGVMSHGCITELNNFSEFIYLRLLWGKSFKGGHRQFKKCRQQQTTDSFKLSDWSQQSTVNTFDRKKKCHRHLTSDSFKRSNWRRHPTVDTFVLQKKCRQQSTSDSFKPSDWRRHPTVDTFDRKKKCRRLSTSDSFKLSDWRPQSTSNVFVWQKSSAPSPLPPRDDRPPPLPFWPAAVYFLHLRRINSYVYTPHVDR